MTPKLHGRGKNGGTGQQATNCCGGRMLVDLVFLGCQLDCKFLL